MFQERKNRIALFLMISLLLFLGHDLSLSHVHNRLRENWKRVPIRPYFSGTLYIYLGINQKVEAETGFAGGGPTTVSTLHWSLNQLGYNTMIYQPSKLVTGVDMLFDTSSIPKIIPIDVFPPLDLNPNDIVIFPEYVVHTATTRRQEVVKAMSSFANGARIIVLTLGLHTLDKYYRETFLDYTVITISEGLSNAVGNMALVPLWRPLDNFFYIEADKYLAAGGGDFFEVETPPKELATGRYRGKEDLVLFDRDTPFRKDISQGLTQRNIQGVWLEKKSHEEMVSLYIHAKVLVDGSFPGPERHPLEASMFGVVPILSDMPRGATYDENPTLPELRVDTSNTIALLKAINSVIEGKVKWGDSNPSEKEARRIKRTWKNGLEFYFSSLGVAFDFIAKPGEEMAAVIAAGHAVFHYPLARIHLGVKSHFLWAQSEAKILANESLISASIFLRYGDDGKAQLNSSLPFQRGGLPCGWRGILVYLPITALISSPCFVKELEAVANFWPFSEKNDAESQEVEVSGCVKTTKCSINNQSESLSRVKIQKLDGKDCKDQDQSYLSKRVSNKAFSATILTCNDKIKDLIRPYDIKEWSQSNKGGETIIRNTTYPSWLVKKIKRNNIQERERAMPKGVMC